MITFGSTEEVQYRSESIFHPCESVHCPKTSNLHGAGGMGVLLNVVLEELKDLDAEAWI